MVSEDPRHGHLNGELDSAAHGELQEEFSEPELGQVTALLQGLCVTGQWQEEGKKWQKRLQALAMFALIALPLPHKGSKSKSC